MLFCLPKLLWLVFFHGPHGLSQWMNADECVCNWIFIYAEDYYCYDQFLPFNRHEIRHRGLFNITTFPISISDTLSNNITIYVWRLVEPKTIPGSWLSKLNQTRLTTRIDLLVILCEILHTLDPLSEMDAMIGLTTYMRTPYYLYRAQTSTWLDTIWHWLIVTGMCWVDLGWGKQFSFSLWLA